MPLSPSPLMPGHSPLPTPGERPASRRALRTGAVVALLTLVAALVPGQLLLPRVVFLAPGLLAKAVSSQNGSGQASFQGFQYLWTRQTHGKGGYTTPASLQTMQSEAHDFHMNTVVIPVIADMPDRDASDLYWQTNQKNDLDTLADQDYVKAIDDARAAGLEPILELQVRQQDPKNTPLQDPKFIGETWYELGSQSSLFIQGHSYTVGALEHGWVDNYAAFAVHFAQLAQQHHVNYLIIGDGLSNLTVDGPSTTAKADPKGIAPVPGDPFDASKCSGRHECEWRHILHAITGVSYSTYIGAHPQTGASYTGKLIYASSYAPGDAVNGTQAEFEGIQWWDAVDAIGVDAFFPLTRSADLQTSTLVDAWHGTGTGLAGQGDIFGRLQKVADKFNKEILFTAAGYESVPGSNLTPGRTAGNAYDPNEQLTDMQALVDTFSGTPWWIGVIWYYDQPMAPRSSQIDPVQWQYGPQWAGDNLGGSKSTDSKLSGVWLSQYYHSAPVPCLC